MGLKKMDNAKYLLNKFMFPSRHREVGGKLDLQTAMGKITIPIEFEIGHIESDIFLESGSDGCDFVAPCSPIPDEFVHVDVVYGSTPTDPNQVQITWAVNSFRTLIWKVSGFTK